MTASLKNERASALERWSNRRSPYATKRGADGRDLKPHALQALSMIRTPQRCLAVPTHILTDQTARHSIRDGAVVWPAPLPEKATSTGGAHLPDNTGRPHFNCRFMRRPWRCGQGFLFRGDLFASPRDAPHVIFLRSQPPSKSAQDEAESLESVWIISPVRHAQQHGEVAWKVLRERARENLPEYVE